MGGATSLQLVYDGPALAHNEMDVRELSPALLAFGELVERANEILNEDRAEISVRVRGSFQTGSFGIETVVDQSLLSSIHDLFGGPQIRSAWDILEALAVVGGACSAGRGGYNGLLSLMRWLRGAEPDRIEILSNETGTVRVYRDEKYLDVEWAVIQLYRDYQVRDALDRVVRRPLERSGVTSFATADSRREEIYASIRERERDWYAAFEPQRQMLGERYTDMTLQLVSPDFSKGNKWRVSDGDHTLYVTLEDEAFNQRVQAGEESFRKGDILRARVRRTEWETTAGQLKAEHAVEEIYEHRHAGQQLALDIRGPGQDDTR